jgi:short-subunit dehydrogenase
MKTDGSVVLVTGSSRGIGAAIATLLQAHGAHVLLHGRDVDQLSALAAGLGAKTLAVDLCRPDAPEALAEQARDVYGHVDALVHCAGIGWCGASSRMADTRVAELIDVNLRAPIELTHRLLPDMLSAHHGHVCFIASVAGLVGVARETVYSATKAALIAYARGLRLELAHSGVGVSVVSPGAVRTEFCASRGQPYQRRFPRPIPAERVASTVVRTMAQDRAAAVVPRWMAIAPAVQAVAPAVYRALAGRFG